MKIEDIKVGEIYNVHVRVLKKSSKAFTAQLASSARPGDTFVFSENEMTDFSPVNTENGIKNTESAPKYDLCRKFRKGDKVKLRKQFLGRETTFSKFSESKFNFDDIYTIEEDEEPQPSLVAVASNDGEYSEEFCFYEIELVTPVEEVELFYVCENTESKSFEVRRKEDHKVQAAFYYFSEDDTHVKRAAAKATLEHCDRLNAEHRKEMEQ